MKLPTRLWVRRANDDSHRVEGISRKPEYVTLYEYGNINMYAHTNVATGALAHPTNYYMWICFTTSWNLLGIATYLMLQVHGIQHVSILVPVDY